MTLIVCAYVPTGIVISGDSRTTGTLQQVAQPSGPTVAGPLPMIQTNVVISDAAQKVFLLHHRFGVGTFGDAIVNNMPIAHYVDEFHAVRANNPPATVQEFSDALLAHFRGLAPVPNVNFIVGGYDNTEPVVMVVAVQGNVVQRVNRNPAQPDIQYGILRGGDTAIVDRLLSQPQFNPPFNVMNVQDAVDYSRHLIRTTIDQMRFEPRFATVGGAIDTLVLSPADSRFLLRKELHC